MINDQNAKPKRGTFPLGLFHLCVTTCAVGGGSTSSRILSSSSEEDEFSWVRDGDDDDDDDDVPPLTTRRDISLNDLPGDLKLSSKLSGSGGVACVDVDDIVMVCVVAIFERETLQEVVDEMRD